MIPGFVDSHTHLVFAGDRAEEFAARMAGAPVRGRRDPRDHRGDPSGVGRASSSASARSRRDEARRAGITQLEIKSGYGLDVETERRLCEVATRLTDEVTFLGAHAVPAEYEGRADDYVALVCGEMLAACAPHCRWIDVFCERGAFDAEQSRAVLEAGRAAGLGLRVHGNQLGPGPGVRLAVELGAASVDHCTYLDDADIAALAAGETVATFLPATDFSTREPYPDARPVIDAGATVAIATNCNPGSSYTTSMAFCIALAVRDLRMTAEEALQAATVGGARAAATRRPRPPAPRRARRRGRPRRALATPTSSTARGCRSSRADDRRRARRGAARRRRCHTGSMAAIELRGVVKRFGPITAVDGIDLDVPAGICLGLLGPNGAGKSTTMRLLTGQAIADEGELRVLGHELPAEAKTARAEMGVVPQLDNLDVDVTVEENLAVFARLYRVPDVGAAVDRALELARLTERRRSAVDELSGGMRRRLLLARGLVHSPRLLLLDEPTVGLDPQIRTQIWSLIDGLRSQGATILMSTHYIEEAERLADEVAVMANGRIVARGRPADLIAEHAGRETVEVYGPPERLAEVRAAAEAQALRVRPAGPAVAIVGAERAEDGATPEDAIRRAASLEDVFVLLTGEEAE